MQIVAVGVKAGNPGTRWATLLPTSRSHDMVRAGEGTRGSLPWILAKGRVRKLLFAPGLCTSAQGQLEQFAGAQPMELLSYGPRAERSRAVDGARCSALQVQNLCGTEVFLHMPLASCQSNSTYGSQHQRLNGTLNDSSRAYGNAPCP